MLRRSGKRGATALPQAKKCVRKHRKVEGRTMPLRSGKKRI